MKLLLPLLLLLLPWPTAAATPPHLDYQVYYAPQLATEGLRVQVRVRTPRAADSTYFHFANELWGETNLLRCVSGLTGAAPGYRFRMVPDSNRIVVYHPRGREVRFSYRLKQDAAEYARDQANRPRVTDTYFHVLGELLFAVPEFLTKAPAEPTVTAAIRWVGFPAGYVLHNTFASQPTQQTFRGKLQSEFYRSLFVGGDYRLLTLNLAGRPGYVAVRAQWPGFDDARLRAAAEQAISAQRAVWQDPSPANFTVFLTPTFTTADTSWHRVSMRGEGLHRGFKLESTNTPYNNWDLLRHLLNHEMQHEWIGGQIKPAHEELNYWFTEGFTDYYAYKNRLRSGELTLAQWVQAFNADVLEKLYANPERNQPNYLIKDNFWKSRSFEKLPYRRGAVFAFWLDNQILKRSNYTRSLDDLMRELRQDCLPPGQSFTDERFLALAQSYLREDISYEFQKYILSGADLPLTQAALLEGLAVEATSAGPVLQVAGPAATVRDRYLPPQPATQPVAQQ